MRTLPGILDTLEWYRNYTHPGRVFQEPGEGKVVREGEKGDKKMNRKKRLHLLQWRVIPGHVQGNLAAAQGLLERAEPAPGDLVLLPEMFPCGFFYSDLPAMAGKSGEVLSWMEGVSRELGVSLSGSLPLQDSRGIVNTMFLVDGGGNRVASYEKIHLFEAAEENRHFAAGDRTVTARWEGTLVGLAICFDLRFPELARRLCDQGARILLVSAQWPQQRVDHFRDFVRVRAMENQMFVAAVNSCGSDDKGLTLGGGSTVVGPGGAVLGVLGNGEGLLSVEVDVGLVEKTRENFPVLKVRRKDVFGDQAKRKGENRD